MTSVDLNCDMGESFGVWRMGDDRAMFDLITSANVACGFHAGDPQTMLTSACVAKEKGVALGAHPSFPDLQGFGRRRILGLTPRELTAMVAYQIGALQAIAALAGHRVTHVKPHGALYNMASESEEVAAAIARGIGDVDHDLIFVVLPATAMEAAGQKSGLSLAREVFADRAYEDDLTLVARGKSGAVIRDPAIVAERVLRMVRDQAVTTVSGEKVSVPVDTICIHGDTAGAVELAKAVRDRLTADGVQLRAFA